MQKLLVITIMLVLATPGCLDSLKDDLVSCDNITGQCRYEILRANEYSTIHLEINYVTGNSPDSDALNLLKQRIKEVTAKAYAVATKRKWLVFMIVAAIAAYLIIFKGGFDIGGIKNLLGF